MAFAGAHIPAADPGVLRLLNIGRLHECKSASNFGSDSLLVQFRLSSGDCGPRLWSIQERDKPAGSLPALFL